MRRLIRIAIFRIKKFFLWPVHWLIRFFFHNEWVTLDLEQDRRIDRRIKLRKVRAAKKKK